MFSHRLSQNVPRRVEAELRSREPTLRVTKPVSIQLSHILAEVPPEIGWQSPQE